MLGMSHRTPGYLLVSHYYTSSAKSESSLWWTSTDHSADVFVALVHDDLDISQVLFGVVQEIEATDAGPQDADAKLASSAVEVVSDPHIRSTGRIR